MSAVMTWSIARERLGAELIGAREDIVSRWRHELREQGALAWALDRCAADLVLQAGAALADGSSSETPWRRCPGLLRIDARDHGRAMAAEISALWQCMAAAVKHLALSVEEEQRAAEILGQQVEAALRGASAELREALLDEAAEESLRFGGVKAVCWAVREELSAADRAA